jgi:hypothetical protein
MRSTSTNSKVGLVMQVIRVLLFVSLMAALSAVIVAMMFH